MDLRLTALPAPTLLDDGLDYTDDARRQQQHHRQHPSQPWPAPGLPLCSPGLYTHTNDEDEDEDEEVPYTVSRPKMFEMGPQDDHAMEERRQRAIYAKRNREMKKREMAKLQHEAAAIRATAEQSQEEVARMTLQAQSQQRRIHELEQSLADARQMLQAREQQLKGAEQRMSRLRAHLEMVAEGCQENSIERRMLLSLLATFS